LQKSISSFFFPPSLLDMALQKHFDNIQAKPKLPEGRSEMDALKGVDTIWTFLDIKRKMTIFLLPVHEFYIIDTFLSNVHAVIHSNKDSTLFWM
jgi:hypothetical protein